MRYAVAKRTKVNNVPNIPYPNAATRRELVHKFLDLLLVGAIGAGLAASVIFILVLG